jgi:hypothetical protein
MFRSGSAALASAVAFDGAVHIAGWHSVEWTSHFAIFVAMLLIFMALVLRGTVADRKESAHASR